MSNQSNDKGRAYEYICLQTLYKEINEVRPASIVDNSSFHAAHRAWETIDIETRGTLIISAKAAVATLFDMEPMILEEDDDCLELYIQPDTKGEVGDVRDIIILRKDVRWEIGLSIKHNHFAVKHSRLGSQLDFGDRWFGIPCSEQYWGEIAPIFAYLINEKRHGTKWSELPNKENDVYIPLLNAFVAEVSRANATYTNVPEKMVEYLLGEFDFYKVISIDNKKVTQIQTYNLRGIEDILQRGCRRHKAYYYAENEAFYKFSKGIVTRKDSIYRVYHDSIKLTQNKMCPTLTASMGIRPNQVPLVVDDYGLRRITIQECLDFQGFPKEFRFPNTIKLEDAYKQIGNSVCVPVVYRIAKQMKEVLTENQNI